MKDLLKFLFQDSQRQADVEDVAENISSLFEDMGKIEGLQIKTAPLAKALKELEIEVKEADLDTDCCGVTWTTDVSCDYLKAKETLLRPENMHTLAELGWVALPAGDCKPTTETPCYKIKFLQIYEPEKGDDEKGEDLEKMIKAAQELGDAHPADEQEDYEDKQKKLAKERRMGVPSKKEKKDESLSEASVSATKHYYKDIVDNWDNYRKEFTDDKDAKPEDYEDAIWDYAEKLAEESYDESLSEAVKYRGYTIEKSGMNYYVKDPKGHRAFGDVPASVETAKKWIDQDLAERSGPPSSKNESDASKLAAKMLGEKMTSFDDPVVSHTVIERVRRVLDTMDHRALSELLPFAVSEDGEYSAREEILDLVRYGQIDARRVMEIGGGDLADLEESEDDVATYRTFKRKATNFEEFSSAKKQTVDTGLTYDEARRACTEFNEDRTEEEKAEGLKMEFEKE